MIANISCQTPGDLDGSAGDNGRTITCEAAEPLAHQSVQPEMEAQAEPASSTGSVPEAVALVEPAHPSWWKRFLAGLLRRRAWKPVVAEASLVMEAVPSPSTVLLPEEGLPEEKAPSPEVPLEPPLPEGQVLAVADEIAPAPETVPPEEAPPAAPSLTLDDVHALVQEELAQAREGMPHIVQAELARQRQDQRYGALLALQRLTDDLGEGRVGLLAAELGVLDEEEPRTLQNPDVPLRERLELVDFIRERRAQVEQQIAEVKTALVQRVAETDLVVAEMEGHGIVAGLREELEQRKQDIAALQARSAAWPRARLGGLGLWPTLLALLLVVAVGVAGTVVPRQAGPAPVSLVDVATLYQAVGKNEVAVELLDKAFRAGIDDAETLGQVGQTYYALEEYQKAVEVLLQAVEKVPQNEGMRLALARSYGQAGQPQEAVAQYERLIEISPDNWRYYLEMGQQYEALAEYDQALAQYQKVVNIAPGRIEGYTSQGELYRNSKRYEEAIEQYRRALEVDPNVFWVRILLGQSYAALQNLERAVEQFRAAIALAPDKPVPYLEMGRVRRTQGKYEEALSWYQDALDVQPDHVPTLLEMGDTYLKSGDCEQAVLYFLRVLEKQPDNRVARDGLEACQSR